LNLAFTTPGWTMRVFGAVVQTPALSMFNLRKDLTLRHDGRTLADCVTYRRQ
jgi:hypothetical protein